MSNDNKNNEDFSFPESVEISPESENESSNNGEQLNTENIQENTMKPQFSETPEKENEESKDSEKASSIKNKKDEPKSSTEPRSSNKRYDLSSLAKKVTLITLAITAVGGGYLWASQKGYVTTAFNPFINEDHIDVDAQQNSELMKLQLRLKDLETNLALAVSASQEEKLEINSQLETVHNKFNKMNNFIEINKTEIKRRTEENKLRIIANENDLGEKFIGITDLSNKYNIISSELNKQNRLYKEIQKKVSSQSKKTNVVKPKKSKPIKAVNHNQNGDKITSNEYVEVDSYKGLKLNNTFHWSSQVVAVLTDSMGTSFQVSKGNKLGHATILDVHDGYLLVKDEVSNKKYKLRRGI